MEQHAGLTAALAQWRILLGSEAVREGEAARRYGWNCIGVERRIPAALVPKTETQVVELVKIARRERVRLYPISTGHNWGYGSANPVQDACVIVDLSRMDRIVEVDEDLDTVTVEPGVTSGQLDDHLRQRNSPLLVPVTGAGPTCSLVGNALERGYGITPHTDHFGAVTALRAVLPDGTLYESVLASAGGERVNRLHKWGVGPYLDGLFSQGNFGIVTEMTIALARRPKVVEMLVFEVSDDRHLEAVVAAVQDLLRAFPGAIAAINLLNQARMLSMMEPYPSDRVGPGQAIPPAVIAEMGRRRLVAPWSGVGAVYSTPEIAGGLRRAIRRRLAPYCRRILFLSAERADSLMRLTRFLPGALGHSLHARLGTLAEAIDILSGHPRETALPLAYWRTGRTPMAGAAIDPARDGCGLIWYAPLVPMTGEAVRAYVSMAQDICPRFGINPLITLTTLSPRCFDSTLPIVFDRETECAPAQACFQALFEAGQRQGFLPYRMSVSTMPLYTGLDCPQSRLIRTLKGALDPDNLMAPGRYAPSEGAPAPRIDP